MKKLLTLCGAVLATAVPASQASAEVLFGLTADNRVVGFDSATPGTTLFDRAITGLASGDVLTGFDLRPANRTLYTVATSGNLYSLTQSGGSYLATLIGDTRPAGNLSGTRIGIDFNPVPDRLRLVTDFDQNLRINVDTAATIVDGMIDAPGAEALTGSAYTNNVAGATTTTLYAIDAGGNQLLVSTNPNAGTYDNVATISGLDFGANNITGFDISGSTGTAYFNIGSSLYTLNLATAAATSAGTIGAGSLIGLTAAAVPEPASWALMIGGLGFAGGMLRRRSSVLRERLA